MTEIDLLPLRAELKKQFQDKIPNAKIDYCLTCGLCASGCMASDIEGMDPRKFIRYLALGQDDLLRNTNWLYSCSICQRCEYACPMGINVGRFVYELKGMRPKEQRPRNLQKTCDYQKESNSTGIPNEDFVWVVGDILEEVHANEPEWADLQAPVDKVGAQFYLNQNAKEPTVEPEEMVPIWKILHTAGIDWTYSSKWWDGANYCLFSGDPSEWEYVTRKQAETVNALGCPTYISTECGHMFYATTEGLKRFNIPHNFKVISIISYYAQWIREGRLKVDSSWNTEGLKFTVQDPCKLVRQGLGDPVAEDLRFVIKKVCGEENFIEVWPNKSNNICCGGGGGALQAGFPDNRRKHGKAKFDQLHAADADVVITPCHNCHAQVMDLAEHYGGKWQTTHLWNWIVKALVK